MGNLGGTPGVTREVAQVMSIWIPATISVASQDLRWPGQQEKLSQGPWGRCRRQSWGRASFPWHSIPIAPVGSGVQDPRCGGWRGVGWLLAPLCSEARSTGSGGDPGFVFGLRAEELQNAAFWGLSRGGGLA